MEAFRQILQGERRNERLHIGYRADALLMAIRPVEAQGPSPVVQDERQRLRSDHLIKEGIKVAGVAHEAVAIRLGAGRDLVGVAHADEIRRDQPAVGGLEVRQDASPQERGGWIAVEEDDRVPRSAFDIGHPAAEHVCKCFSRAQALSAEPGDRAGFLVVVSGGRNDVCDIGNILYVSDSYISLSRNLVIDFV